MFSMADRISALPDIILCHILSFLLTKHAVATSVLSKRWTHLWRSVPALDFSDTKVNDREANFRFNEFVHYVLLLRDPAHPIKSFRLHVIYEYDHPLLDFPGVTKWVNFVVQRGVENLHLHLAARFDIPNLPLSILSCKTLVVLKFSGFRVKNFSSVGLSSLKILHLKDIRFAKLGDLLWLLAGSPMLEDLQASRIFFDSEDPLPNREYKSLSLSRLSRADMDCCDCHFPLQALHNVDYLRIEIDKMYRPYDDVPTFHNLTHLDLFSLNCDWHLLLEVLKNCPKLQNLNLYEGTVKGIREEGKGYWEDPEFVPQCLSSHLITCTLQDFSGLLGEHQLARYILDKARVLQTMTIWSRDSLASERKISLYPRTSARCRLSVYEDNR